jgi:hypothetical protein
MKKGTLPNLPPESIIIKPDNQILIYHPPQSAMTHSSTKNEICERGEITKEQYEDMQNKLES